jgi:ATP-dependent Clp protease protease subunit
LKERINQILAEATGQTEDTIIKDTERDFYMSAEEAVKYGLVDKVLEVPEK